MKAHYYYLSVLLLSCSGVLAEGRSFPHLGHLVAGVVKLGASASCAYVGVQALTNKMGRGQSYLQDTATKVRTNASTSKSLSKTLFDKTSSGQVTSYNLDTSLMGAASMLSLAGASFWGAYKCLVSANDSFSKVYGKKKKKTDALEQGETVQPVVVDEQIN